MSQFSTTYYTNSDYTQPITADYSTTRLVAGAMMSVLGDFHYKGAKADLDYRYDGNGNLTIDNNKGIDSIYYNYLNLPQQVHFKGKGNIFYTYDAAGNKLLKQVIDSVSGLATTTTYVAGGFQYQRRSAISNPSGGTDTLQFLGHEDGRTRWAFLRHLASDTAYAWEYDFMERDHLGNTRVLLTQERDTAQYLATMEPQYRATENALFYNIDSTSYAASSVPHGGFPTEPSGPTPNDSVAMVDGAGHEIGPALLLKVMSGDSISIGCYGYYASGGTVTTPNSSLPSLLNSLASGLFTLTAGTHGTTSVMTNPSNGPVYSSATNFLSSRDTNTTVAPKSYLNWLLLDNQLNYVSGNNQSGAIPIGQPNIFNTLGTSIKFKHSGFLYVWVSNETPNWSVFFDNLSIEHFSGPLLEENHYYPGGLSMVGISDKAIKSNYAENKYKFNGIEYDSSFGLDEYEAVYRNYDPQVGRWTEMDSKPDQSISLYAGIANNPVRYSDTKGDTLYVQNYGQKSATDKFKNIANSGLGGFYKVRINDNGHAYLDKTDQKGEMTKEQKAFYNQMNDLINGKGQTQVFAVENSENTLIGNFEDKEIDVTDIENGANKVVTAASLLAHELAEQKAGQVDGKSYHDAHYDVGIPAENAVSGATRGDLLESPNMKIGNTGIVNGAASTEYTKNGVKYIYTNNIVNNNITSNTIVPEQTKLPKKKP